MNQRIRFNARAPIIDYLVKFLLRSNRKGAFMRNEGEKTIKVHLDKALETNTPVICILKGGLTETEHIDTPNPIIYTKIEFKPDQYYEGYYAGAMFYPNHKRQGLMDFKVDSFLSVICLEED